MLFVGRENEANHITRELQRGNNVVLGGKYGIGRTSLINADGIHIAKMNGNLFSWISVKRRENE